MARNKERKEIKKGNVVWYFDCKLKEWRKGTVHNVDRYGLTIRKRHNAYKGHWARYSGWCYPASIAKPHLPPKEFELWNRAKSTYDGFDEQQSRQTRAYRFLMKLGLK